MKVLKYIYNCYVSDYMLQKVNKIQSGNFEIIFIITTINSGTFFTFDISHFLWFFSFGTMQAI